MKLREAINRLSWRFSQTKTFTPNQNDVDSFNKILEHINQTQKETIHDNLILAKFYAFCLTNFLLRYEDIDFSNECLNRDILAKPLDFHLHKLLSYLKTYELERFFKSKGIKDDAIGLGLNAEEIKQNYFENKETFKNINPDEIIEAYERYNYENVVKFFETNVNLSIQTFKNDV